MNLTMLIARFADRLCARFTALFPSTSQAQDSIPQINSYAQAVDKTEQKLQTRLRHAEVIHMFDTAGTLWARALRGSGRAAKRIARLVAIVIGISLFLPMSHASSGSIEAIKPKDFIRMSMDQRQAVCLIRLYGKESAFNPYAIGNLSGKYHTYGIPQLKNALIADKTAIEQIHYGLKYIDHRYDGDTCKAWNHWLRKGWH